MGFTKITSLSLTDLFVQQVENMILSGELQVGEKLPPERELAIRMGVSRPVISAGLIELEKLGFVEIRPRQGAYICDYRRKGTVETLVAIMRYNGGSMRKKEVESLLQVRIPLESLCVELVIRDTSDEELEELGTFLDKIAEALGNNGSPEAVAEAVFQFHHELAVLSGNMLLPLLYHSFKPEMIYLWSLYGKFTGCRQLYENKLNLYRALLNRDTAEALRLTPGEYPRTLDEKSYFMQM